MLEKPRQGQDGRLKQKSYRPEPVVKKVQSLYFSLFNEIGIISQLSRALLDARLPDGLSSSHFGILSHLIQVQDGRTPLELASAFQVPKTTMTHTLSGLDTHKLVEMRPNPKDGRSKCVWITQKGLLFRDQAIADLEPELIRFSTQISKGQIDALVSNLARIRKFMDSSRDQDS